MINDKPTLMSEYGTDSVEIPWLKEWTGEFRPPTTIDTWLTPKGTITTGSYQNHRLILRNRVSLNKVKIECDPEPRIAKRGEYVVWGDGFRIVDDKFIPDNTDKTENVYITGTRVESWDNSPTIVTQADIDKAGSK